MNNWISKIYICLCTLSVGLFVIAFIILALDYLIVDFFIGWSADETKSPFIT